VLPETKHLKYSGFILKVKKKDRKEALPRVRAGGDYRFFSCSAQPYAGELTIFFLLVTSPYQNSLYKH